MILVFSSAEDALSNDVNKHNTFSSQGTENPPFRFFGKPGIAFEARYFQLAAFLWGTNSPENVTLLNTPLGP